MKLTKRNILNMSILAVVATLLMSTASFAGLYRIQNGQGGMNVYKISSYSYRAVVGDAGDSNKIVAARDGVVDVFVYTAGEWQMTPFAATGKTYTALTRHHNWSGFYYGANAAGGITKLTLYWDNAKAAMALQADPIPATDMYTYTALATKAANNEEAVLAARAGALDYAYVSESEWSLWENVLNNGRTYTALASSATWGNFYYGVWSGGIDKISFNGYSWAANTIAGTANKGYTALTNDKAWDNYIYASRNDGSMDKIQEPNISPVGGAAQTFTSLSSAVGYRDYMYGTDAPRSPVAMSNRALTTPCGIAYGNIGEIVIWGNVTQIDFNTFSLDDGSGAPVTVVAPGYMLWGADYVRAQGYMDYSVYPYQFRSWADGVSQAY